MALNPVDYQFIEAVTITDEPLLTIFEFMRCFYNSTEDDLCNRILYSEIFENIQEILNTQGLLDDKWSIDNRCYLTLLGFISSVNNDRTNYYHLFTKYTYDKNTDKKLVYKYRAMLQEIVFTPDKFKNPVNFLLFSTLKNSRLDNFQCASAMEKAIYRKTKIIIPNWDDKSSIAPLMLNLGLSNILSVLRSKQEFEYVLDLISLDAFAYSTDESRIDNVCIMLFKEWHPKYNIPSDYNNPVRILKYLCANKCLILMAKSDSDDNIDKMYILQEMINFLKPIFTLQSPKTTVSIINERLFKFPDIGQKLSSWINSGDETKSLDDSIYVKNSENDTLFDQILS